MRQPRAPLRRERLHHPLAVAFESYSSESQYDSNAARNLSRSGPESRQASRTFHSSPSCSAACERFDEPMYAVWLPLSRWKSQAFAWRRVRRSS